MSSHPFHFNGSLYGTLPECARDFAADALIDPSMVGVDVDAHEYAAELERIVHDEDARLGTPELPLIDGRVAVEEDAWRAVCRDAIEARILEARRAAVIQLGGVGRRSRT